MLAFQTRDSDRRKKICESVPERFRRCINADRYQLDYLK